MKVCLISDCSYPTGGSDGALLVASTASDQGLKVSQRTTKREMTCGSKTVALEMARPAMPSAVMDRGFTQQAFPAPAALGTTARDKRRVARQKPPIPRSAR